MIKFFTIFFIVLMTNTYAQTLFELAGIKNTTSYTVPTEGISLTGNLTINKDIIRINGPILTQGHALELIATEIHFGKKAAIYNFENKLQSELSFCTRRLPRRDDQQKINPEKATTPGVARGASSGAKAANGTNGAHGKKGHKGLTGLAGKVQNLPINIYATRIYGAVKLKLKGQTGGSGGLGGPGQHGQNGGKGGRGYADCDTFIVVTTSTNQRSSGNGGNGGKAGEPGDGGDGGIGGTNQEVNIISGNPITKANDSDYYSHPGNPGRGGSLAKPGKPGEAGAPGDRDEDKPELDLLLGSVTLCHVKSRRGKSGVKYADNEIYNEDGLPPRKGNTGYMNKDGTGSCYNIKGKKEAITEKNFTETSKNALKIISMLKDINIYKRLYVIADSTFQNALEILFTEDGQNSLSIDEKVEIIGILINDWESHFLELVEKAKYKNHEVLDDVKNIGNMVTVILENIKVAHNEQYKENINKLTKMIRSNFFKRISKLSYQCLDYRKDREKQVDSIWNSTSKISRTQEKEFKSCLINKEVKYAETDKAIINTSELNRYINSIKSSYLPSREKIGSVMNTSFCDSFNADHIFSQSDNIINVMTKDFDLMLTGRDNINLENIDSPNTCSSQNEKELIRNIANDSLFNLMLGSNMNKLKLIGKLYNSNTNIYQDLKLTKIKSVNKKRLDLTEIKEELIMTSALLGAF